jgi:hypothetical protein
MNITWRHERSERRDGNDEAKDARIIVRHRVRKEGELIRGKMAVAVYDNMMHCDSKADVIIRKPTGKHRPSFLFTCA